MNRNDNFVKRRKFPKSLKKGTGGCNPCFRPSADASKVDLVEMHQEDMRLRRSHQRDRQPGFQHVAGSLRAKSKDAAEQLFEPLPNGGYRTLHATKGWRTVSPKRLRHFSGAVA